MLKKNNGLNKSINLTPKKEELSEKILLESYNNFILHYKEPKIALKKDIYNIKNCKTPHHERNFIWFFFLGIIPFKHPLKWQKYLTEERAKYLSLKKKYFTKHIEDFIELKRLNDTFKYDEYKTIFSKEEFDLLNLIKMDADRTYQENEIFLKEEIKKKLICALYIYAKENPKIGYRQGMNDICGVFLYILYKNYELNDDFGKDTISCIYSIFHSNNDFLEYDLYILFSKFMNKGIADFFLYNSIQYKKSFLTSKTFEEIKSLSIDDIFKCDDCDLKKRIYWLYFKQSNLIDPDFFEYLVKNVKPELFLVRWYLCMFTREFKLEQIVYLWDFIIFYEFAESKLYENRKLKWHYNFMDCIALSMILNCKSDLIEKESLNDLMSSLIHYPNNVSIEKIAKKALEIYLKMNPEIKL